MRTMEFSFREREEEVSEKGSEGASASSSA